jgi:glycosyltransferase involved in cell wall biosynthesis
MVNPSSALLVTPRWARDGGVATHVMASAEALAGHGVDVAVLSARIEAPPAPGVRLLHSPELFNADVPAEVRVGDALGEAPDVVHLQQVDDPEILDVLRARSAGVISAHGYTACTSGVYYFRPGQQCTRGHGPGCIPNLIARGCAHTRDPRTLPPGYRRATRGLQALREADLVISYSSGVDRHLFANGITQRSVVPLFTTMIPRTGSGHATRRRVVFAGRVVPIKGVAVLIRAARELPGTEFVICGDGWGLAKMRKLARRTGVQERVLFKGWLGAEQLAHELAEASVVAVPSLWPEPFGLVGIEALAAGRPVVASATGGIEDWLQDGVSGLTVKPGDANALARALAELLDDPERQQALGAAGRDRVAAQFSRERHVEVLLEAYRKARELWQAERSGPAIARPAVGAGAQAGGP